MTFRLPDAGFVQNEVQKTCEEDALGSAVAARDSSGALVSRSLFDAYGLETVVDPGVRGDYRFAGKHGYVPRSARPPTLPSPSRSAPGGGDDTGTRMLGARYYLPAIGRFLTQDPTGHEGGLNLYACCANSPPAARLVDKKPPNDL